MPFQALKAEDLIPVVADPTAGPAIPATAHQTHRIGVCRREERLGCGGPPVDQKPTTRAVGEADPPDVYRLGAVCDDHAAEANVQIEATQHAQVSGQPVDLQVPIQRCPPLAPRGLALGVELVGQVSDLLRQALRDGCQVLLVASNQRRVRLGDKIVGKVEHIGGHGDHVIISNIDMKPRPVVAGGSVCRCDELVPLSAETPGYSDAWRTAAIGRSANRCRKRRSQEVGPTAPMQAVRRRRLSTSRARSAPPLCVPATVCTAYPPSVRRPAKTGRSTTNPALCKTPLLQLLAFEDMILLRTGGLAASPPVRYTLKTAEQCLVATVPLCRCCWRGQARWLRAPGAGTGSECRRHGPPRSSSPAGLGANGRPWRRGTGVADDGAAGWSAYSTSPSFESSPDAWQSATHRPGRGIDITRRRCLGGGCGPGQKADRREIFTARPRRPSLWRGLVRGR